MQQDLPLLKKIERDFDGLSKASKRIADFILKHPNDFIHKSINQLSKQIEVSEPTLIRFCRKYEFDGIPDFRIALASSFAQSQFKDANILEPKISDREKYNIDLKRAIAERAMEFVEENDAIIVDSGSTMSIFAESLVHAKPLTILTTGINVMVKLWDAKQHKLLLPGGIVNPASSSLRGRMVENSIKLMNFDTLFLGASSILSDQGLSTFDEDEADQNRMMIERAKKLIILADSSKFEQSALHHICGFDAVHAVITDHLIADEHKEMIEKNGVTLVIAE